jgi:uncharacterized protein YjbI with pentapeptide repeats
MSIPLHLPDEAFKALRCGDIERYNRLVANRREIDFSNSDLRGSDLRRIDLTHVKLKGAYLKDCDLRGQDMRHVDLEGASLHNSKVGGVYFPDNISSDELQMSLVRGTRLRVLHPIVANVDGS